MSDSSDHVDGEGVRPRPRFHRPERQQVEMRFLALDQLLPEDHRARAVWQFVASLDLSPLYGKIKAVEGGVGRHAVDPRILMAIWMLATLEGISSARKLAELSTRDLAYLWICGGVGVNHHLLSDFRTGHVEFLDQLLTDSVAALLHQHLATLDRVAQDGMRVRAHAGSGSFRRQASLEECQRQAREQVELLRQESEAEDKSSGDRRTKAARLRAAQEKEERIQQALLELKELQAKKEQRKQGDGENARASATDPEARKMKMADGGFRPAYNVQFATACAGHVIVGVDVVNAGADAGLMQPMAEQIERRYRQRPREYLVDGGFAAVSDIASLESQGIQVFAPVKEQSQRQARGDDPYARRPADTDEVFRWRQRMSTEEAKLVYRQRAATAEHPNAECRNRGLTQFRVRGLAKVKAVALWHALAFNFLRARCLSAS